MYQKQPTITGDLSHKQLLELMMLADRYAVPKVQAAVLEAFKEVPAEQLQWETALALLDLPPSCAGQDAFKSIQQLAAKRLVQQLGDLELVWAGDYELQQQLLNLPHAALLQLLQHPETRVGCENTVFYTIERWFERHTLQQRTYSNEQLKQLLQLVRMRHCSSLFIITVMGCSEVVNRCLTPFELLVARECSSEQGLAALRGGKCLVLQQHPAWAADKRPASAKEQVLEWNLSLQQVKEAVEQHLTDRRVSAAIFSKPSILQGQALKLGSRVKTNTSGSGTDLEFGLFLHAVDLSPHAVRQITAKYTAVAAPAAAAAGGQQAAGRGRRGTAATDLAPQGDVVYGPYCLEYSRAGNSSWGSAALFTLSAVSSWVEVEQALKAKGLVHGDGCIHFKVDVLKML